MTRCAPSWWTGWWRCTSSSSSPPRPCSSPPTSSTASWPSTPSPASTCSWWGSRPCSSPPSMRRSGPQRYAPTALLATWGGPRCGSPSVRLSSGSCWLVAPWLTPGPVCAGEGLCVHLGQCVRQGPDPLYGKRSGGPVAGAEKLTAECQLEGVPLSLSFASALLRRSACCSGRLVPAAALPFRVAAAVLMLGGGLQEKLMLNTLKFNLTVPTPYVFMCRILKAAGADKQVSRRHTAPSPEPLQSDVSPSERGLVPQPAVGPCWETGVRRVPLPKDTRSQGAVSGVGMDDQPSVALASSRALPFSLEESLEK
jgi:hypothetical protein